MRCYNALSTIRYGLEINNTIDSLNIALTYWLNDNYCRQSKHFLHVTHGSSSVLAQEGIRWGVSEEDRQSLVRTPAFITTRVLCREQEARLPRDYVKEGLEIMNKVRCDIEALAPDSRMSMQRFLSLEQPFKRYLTDYYGLMKQVIEIDSKSSIQTDNVIEEVEEALKNKEEYVNRLSLAHEKILERLEDVKSLFQRHRFLEGMDTMDDYFRY